MDWPVAINVPYDHLAVTASCEQVVLVRLCRAPVDIEYVLLVRLLELCIGFERLLKYTTFCLRKDRVELLDLQYPVDASGGKELSVGSELERPEGAISTLYILA